MLETVVVIAAVAAALLYMARRLKRQIDLTKKGPEGPGPGCPGCSSCSSEPGEQKTG